MEENITKDGGVHKKILTVGSGECPKDKTRVTVSYIGKFTDGTIFDTGDSKFSFVLGDKEVIKGWDLAVATMKKGEKAIVTIKSDYAYGDDGFKFEIPPKATLIFEITLVSIS